MAAAGFLFNSGWCGGLRGRGLRGERENVPAESEIPAQRNAGARGLRRGSWRPGVRGETYAYWYLPRNGYAFVARNYVPRGAKGEINLIGYDGETLAFVEVRTRTVSDAMTAPPELSVMTDKQRVVVRTARRFLRERHVGNCPCRFEVLAVDNPPGMTPEVRLPKVRLVLRCERVAGRSSSLPEPILWGCQQILD
jgi:putative endonuclease